MRIGELRAYLAGCDDASEVFLQIDLDFLEGRPELLADFKVAYDDTDTLLVASVRRGDLAPEADSDERTGRPCDGCPLDAADDFYFEHSDIDSLLEAFCDRPGNRYRCCFLPEPPVDDDDDANSVSALSTIDDELPF